jgi:putative SOS response-associated peptidase YedK
MCGRFTLTSSLEQIKEQFQTAAVKVPELEPGYNIAPSMEIPAVIWDGEQRRLGMLAWGFTTGWGGGKRLINARAESLYQKPAFRESARHRRCIVPADGFFEWRKTGDGKKPYYIYPESGKLLALAGLWRKEDDGGYTCAIVTAEANEDMKDLHHRMPLFLGEEDQREWLDTTKEDVRHLLISPDSGLLKMHPVSVRVNKPQENDPSLLEPAE